MSALLHSSYPRGGKLIREDLTYTIAHLVAMQYSTVELRNLALEDVLAGPGKLHEMLPTRLAEVNKLRKQFTDAQLEADREAFPEIRRKKPPRKGRDIIEIPSRVSRLITAGLAPIRQLRPTRELSQDFPEIEIRAMDAKWYRLASYDSAVVSMNDGTSAALYKRDPKKFRELARKHRRAAPAADPRVAAAGGGVPRRVARRHLAGDLGGDVPPVERPPSMTDQLTPESDSDPARTRTRTRSPFATTSPTCR